ncbi:hypothetical protein BJY04DRAFT_181617 [Aspergillus karnatakaensis]|uniref:uncharacterized protein n=1 Tax=Aspergillus karnatakaensis TaxID=1810916 RepID=UPI003CCC97BF
MQLQPDPHEFEFAIICALPREFNAVDALLDERFSDLATIRQYGDPNFYQTGRMGICNVVLVCLPEMGKASAASAAANLRSTFPSISLTLIVGVCGGVPFPTEGTEIILGDVITSQQVVKFDFGRQYPGVYERKGVVKDTLDRSNTAAQSLLSGLRTRKMRDRFHEAHWRCLQPLQKTDSIWSYPGVDKDRLMPSSCQNCIPISSKLGTHTASRVEPIMRKRLNTGLPPQPCLHLGPIGSGDTVMKSAKHRDELARSDNVIGFEMEGAGVCEALSCLTIKGVCDYADCHKNKDWQDYAAASAACCAKVFFELLTEVQYHKLGAIMYSRAFRTDTGRRARDMINRSIYWQEHSVAIRQVPRAGHVQSVHEGLRRFEEESPSPATDRSLVLAGDAVIQRSEKDILKTNRFIQSEPRQTLFGTIYIHIQITSRQNADDEEATTRTETKTSFLFHPANWLLRLGLKYGLSGLASKNSSTWQYSIRPVYAVPENALIFRFCESGNVDAVRELISGGEASVHDTDHKGQTPLHVAVHNGHLGLAKILISEGADRTARVYDAMYHALWGSRYTPETLIVGFILTLANEQIRMNQDIFELFTLFGDCIEFCEPESNGWSLLTSLDWSQGYLDYDPQVHRGWYSFLLRKYREEYTTFVDYRSILSALNNANDMMNVEGIYLILEFVPPGRGDADLISAANGPWEQYLHYPMIQQILIERGASIQLQALFSGETPTSMSCHFSQTFLEWRYRLSSIQPSIDTIIRRELSDTRALSLSGWTDDAFRRLFSLKDMKEAKRRWSAYETYMTGDKRQTCDVCSMWRKPYPSSGYLNGLNCIVEPWWESLKRSIRKAECICSSSKWVQDGCSLDWISSTSAVPRWSIPQQLDTIPTRPQTRNTAKMKKETIIPPVQHQKYYVANAPFKSSMRAPPYPPMLSWITAAKYLDPGATAIGQRSIIASGAWQREKVGSSNVPI